MFATALVIRECSVLPNLRLVIFILVMATATGCARWGDRREPHRLDAWIGKSERKLVLAAGAPDSIHELKDGSRILTWHRRYSERQGGETTTENETRTVGGQTVIVPVTRQEPTFEFHYECMANFEIDATGIVRAHNMKGNDCDSFLK
jgi:hypothetical protein